MPPEFQTAFAEGLASGALPPGVTSLDPAETPRRFAVYRNNVTVSLSGALAARFPVIRRMVGAEFFAAMARVFLADNLPASPVLHEWGAAFTGFLAGFAPLAPYPALPDVARIEWARGIAYHAADVPPLPPAGLAEAAQQADRVRLTLHPSVGLIRSPHPAVSLWAANQPGLDGSTPARGPEAGLILRDRALAVQVWPLSPADAEVALALLRGAALAEAARSHDPTALLLRLSAAGGLTDAKVTT